MDLHQLPIPPESSEPPSTRKRRLSLSETDVKMKRFRPHNEPVDLSKIPLKDIIQNFAEENIIEHDHLWIVHKGELSGKKLAFISIRERYTVNRIAFRELSELTKHQNVVSLIGICEEDYPNTIFAVEHPTRGGLDKYVSSTAHLTWLMRVKISLDIASGLHYLQNHPQTWNDFQDLNSASIHLNENWQAKIHLISPSALIQTSFRRPGAPSFSAHHRPAGVSSRPGMIRRASHQPPTPRSPMAYGGQLGYVDPLYIQTGKKSDIYPYGVILFELLCARPAITYDEEGGTQFLSKLARSHYEKGTLTDIIDPLLRVQMNTDSIAIFSELAYRCLNQDPSKRPTISVL